MYTAIHGLQLCYSDLNYTIWFQCRAQPGEQIDSLNFFLLEETPAKKQRNQGAVSI